MPRLYAPAGRTGEIHSRNNPSKVYQIDENGMVAVEAHDDISDLLMAGFSYSPVPQAAAAMEAADLAEAEAKHAADEADVKAKHAKLKRDIANQAHADAEKATGGQPMSKPVMPQHAEDRTVFKGGNVGPAGPVGTASNRQPLLGGEMADPKAGTVYKSDTGTFTVDHVNTDGRVVGKWDDGLEMTYQRSELDAMNRSAPAPMAPEPGPFAPFAPTAPPARTIDL